MKQILVVDDHFEMLEFLRSMLEASNDEYQVLGVPSAEEGFFALRRTPFDLLITDVRLPGMSGFELVRRVQGVRPDIPILMITAYSSTRGKEEAESLGIDNYFQKPLRTDALLTAVHDALYGGRKPVEEKVETKPVAERAEAALSSEREVLTRLQTLRSDTGATQVVLADAHGTVLFADGSENQSESRRLAPIMASSLENSLRLAEELGSVEPQTIQYQSGPAVDLYSANIGRDYFIMLFFERQARRGRIGTVWIFAQRAVRDLKELLESAEGSMGWTEEPTPGPERGDEEQEAGATSPRRKTEDASQREDRPEPAAAASVPEEVSEETDGGELALLLEQGEMDGDGLDLDAFWETASSEEQESPAGGLTLDEAREQGLIPPEFDEPEG